MRSMLVLSLLLLPLSQAEAQGSLGRGGVRRRPTATRRHPLQLLVKPQNIAHLSRLRLDPRILRRLVDNITNSRQGTPERELVKLFDRGLTNLRAMRSKVRVASTQQKLKEESLRWVKATDTLFRARSLRVEVSGGSTKISSRAAPGVEVEAGSRRGRHTKVDWITSELRDAPVYTFERHFLGYELSPGVYSREEHLVGWLAERRSDGSFVELGEDSRPRNRPGYVLQRLTYAKSPDAAHVNVKTVEKAIVDAKGKMMPWVITLEESGSPPREGPPQIGWTVTDEVGVYSERRR